MPKYKVLYKVKRERDIYVYKYLICWVTSSCMQNYDKGSLLFNKLIIYFVNLYDQTNDKIITKFQLQDKYIQLSKADNKMWEVMYVCVLVQHFTVSCCILCETAWTHIDTHFAYHISCTKLRKLNICMSIVLKVWMNLKF